MPHNHAWLNQETPALAVLQVEEDEEHRQQSNESTANAKQKPTERLPGTEGAYAIQAVGTPPEQPKFGAIEQTDIADGRKIREQFSSQQ